MATIALQPARVQEVAKARVEYSPEAASQSFKEGQLVYLSSGKVTACASDQPLIAGMALQDASGTEDTKIAVAIARPGVWFEMNVYHATPASAVTAVTDVGKKYGLYVADNKCYCDKEDTVNTRFVVVALSPQDSVGDQYGRVFVEVLGSVCQLSGVES